jgi:hypothetical protein
VAKCDEGYRCEVCGRDVEAITDSDLYLRFVLGEVPLETLHLSPSGTCGATRRWRSISSTRTSRRWRARRRSPNPS